MLFLSCSQQNTSRRKMCYHSSRKNPSSALISTLKKFVWMTTVPRCSIVASPVFFFWTQGCWSWWGLAYSLRTGFGGSLLSANDYSCARKVLQMLIFISIHSLVSIDSALEVLQQSCMNSRWLIPLLLHFNFSALVVLEDFTARNRTLCYWSSVCSTYVFCCVAPFVYI